MGSYTWTGMALSNSWENATNWQPEGVPKDDDDIIVPGTPAARNQGPIVPPGFRARNLTLGGNSYLAGSTLSVAERFTFESGTLAVSVDIEPGATLSFTGTAGKGVKAITITNNGTIAIDGTGRIAMSEGAVIKNRGTTEGTASAELFWVSGAPVTFENDGLLSVANPLIPLLPTTLRFNGVGLVTRGRVRVDSGTLELDGPGGRHRFLHGARITTGPGGRIRVLDSGVAVVEGLVALDSGTFEIAAGGSLVDVTVPAGSPAPLFDCGATLLWSGGTLAANVRLELSARMRLVGAALKYFNKGVVENHGVIEFAEDTILQFGGGSRILNQSLLHFYASTLLQYGFGEGGTIDNQGAMKLFATGTSSQEVPKLTFNNVNFVSQGLFDLEYGQVRFELGAFRLRQGAGFTGRGKVVLAGGTMTLEADASVSANTTFELTAKGTLATLDPTAAVKKQLVCSGLFLWTGGTLKAQLSLREGSRGELSGTAEKNLFEGVLVNEGLLTWRESGALAGGGGGKLRNEAKGTLASAGTVRMYRSYGAQPSFENRGTLAITGGKLTMDGATLANHGTVRIGPGRLQLQGTGIFEQRDGSTQLLDGTLATATTQSQLFLYGGQLFGHGTIEGTLQHQAGTLSPGHDEQASRIRITGDYKQLSDAADLRIRIAGILPEAGFSLLDVAGIANLRGMLTLIIADGYEPPDETSFGIVRYGTRAGTFRFVDRPYFAGHTFLEQYQDKLVAAEVVSARLLAQRLLANPAVTLRGWHDSGIVDNAFAVQNVVDASHGIPASRSNYADSEGHAAPGGTVPLTTHLLVALTVLARANRYSVTELAGGAHSVNSRHYAGVAFDINELNGQHIGFTHPTVAAFMQACRDLGMTEVLGPGTAGHDTHIHAAWNVTAA